MPYPDEYTTWRCDNPETAHPGRDCEAVWQVCDSCWNHDTGRHEPEGCDDCSGAGGGHTCLYALEAQEAYALQIPTNPKSAIQINKKAPKRAKRSEAELERTGENQ